MPPGTAIAMIGNGICPLPFQSAKAIILRPRPRPAAAFAKVGKVAFSILEQLRATLLGAFVEHARFDVGGARPGRGNLPRIGTPWLHFDVFDVDVPPAEMAGRRASSEELGKHGLCVGYRGGAALQ